MPDVPAAVLAHYRAQQRQSVLTVSSTRRQWARMGADLDASWRSVGPQLVRLVTAGQLGSARAGAAYVPAALAEQGLTLDADGLVAAERLAGVAADGRTLEGLLYGAVVDAREQLVAGAPPRQALAHAGGWLDQAVHTAVVDAGRAAAQVGIAARPRVGWVRMLNPPSCKRCAVLAGKFFRWNSGFRRHPACDCVHIPTSEALAGDLTTDGAALARAGGVKGLTQAERAALAEGADLSQLVNAQRGAAGMTTTEGAGRRGFARSRLGAGRQRLTPDGIYRVASDRDEAVRLLRANGYLL